MQPNKSKTLLGIGNPLLDISVKVDQAFLDKYQKKAGNAVLASEADLPLYKEIQAFSDVLYIAGGSTQNSIRGAQWMSPVKGVTHFIGSVGHDDNAQKLRNSANFDGVMTHYYVSKTFRTGCCAVLIKENERSLIADLAAANDYQHEHYLSAEIQSLVQTIDIFYSAGFFLTVSPQTVVEIGKHCAEHNKILVWGAAAPFIVEFYYEKVQAVLPYVDYIVANETEAEKLTEKMGLKGKSMEEVMKSISELPKVNQKRSRVVIFTFGPDPVLIYRDGKLNSFDVPKLDKSAIVDTNGAGDAFLGGFLAGLLQDKSLNICVKAGLYAARHILQVSGTQYTKACDFIWE
jgi:adenosine kinase